MPTLETVDARGLVGPELYRRLVTKAAAIGPDWFGRSEAERAVDGAIGFLVKVGREGSEGQRPTRVEDLGWHAFLLFTREYAEFCHRTAGRFIHHAPDDDGDCGEVGCGAGRPPDTI